MWSEYRKSEELIIVPASADRDRFHPTQFDRSSFDPLRFVRNLALLAPHLFVPDIEQRLSEMALK
jgi:hypothetical protein